MTCALCLQEKELCNSHIIPELLYKPIYDKNPKRFFAVSTNPTAKFDFEQKGYREKLLCKQCEGRFNKWETYVSKILDQKVGYIEGNRRVTFVNLDYKNFKLFQLSLLWRAGVSSLEEFSDVTLGPHREKLRKMLLKENPGSRNKYGCSVVLCPKYREILKHLIISPDTIKVKAHHIVRFSLAGLFWHFFVSSHTPSIATQNVFLNKNGELPILFESKYSEQYIENLAHRWESSGNIDEVLNKF